jgi:hypothetical protein
MDIREVAAWLANVDGSNECTDDEFAELFVLLYKMWKNNDPEAKVTKDDMLNFDEFEFADWLRSCLGEIINSDEVDQSAWWKKED